MASTGQSSVGPCDGAADCSSSSTSKPTPKTPPRCGPPSNSAGAGASAQGPQPADAPSSANDSQPGAAHRRRSADPSAAIEDQPDAANPRRPTAPSAANGNQPGAANPWRPSVLLMKLLALVSFGGRAPQVCQGMTRAPPLPHSTMALNCKRQQSLLAIPLMAAISKLSHVWSRLGCWAIIPYFLTASSRGAAIFRSLSSKLAEGGFAARLCSYVLGWIGYEGRPFARVAEFIDLVSTLFRHASSTLKSAADILNKVNEFSAVSGANPRTSQASAASSDESNEAISQETTDINKVNEFSSVNGANPLTSQASAASSDESKETVSQETIGTMVDNGDSHGGQPGVQQIIICSLSEVHGVISRWKGGSNQISVDVSPNMSVKTAVELKKQFVREGAKHLLQGATINSIQENGLVSANSEAESATQKFEEILRLSVPSSSSDSNTDQ